MVGQITKTDDKWELGQKLLFPFSFWPTIGGSVTSVSSSVTWAPESSQDTDPFEIQQGTPTKQPPSRRRLGQRKNQRRIEPENAWIYLQAPREYGILLVVSNHE